MISVLQDTDSAVDVVSDSCCGCCIRYKGVVDARSYCVAGVPQEGINIFGMYEPIHGSAPRRAGLNMANPTAIILSIAMMLRYSLGLIKEAQTIETAVDEVLNEGYRTYDIMDEGKIKVGTKEMGDLIAGKVGG